MASIMKYAVRALSGVLVTVLSSAAVYASEADLVLPDLKSVTFVGVDGHRLLVFGLLICVFGLLFGFLQYVRTKKLPVHKSMGDISDLIYETCKTYLITQGKFLILLEIFLGVIIVVWYCFCK